MEFTEYEALQSELSLVIADRVLENADSNEFRQSALEGLQLRLATLR